MSKLCAVYRLLGALRAEERRLERPTAWKETQDPSPQVNSGQEREAFLSPGGPGVVALSVEHRELFHISFGVIE